MRHHKSQYAKIATEMSKSSEVQQLLPDLLVTLMEYYGQNIIGYDNLKTMSNLCMNIETSLNELKEWEKS